MNKLNVALFFFSSSSSRSRVVAIAVTQPINGAFIMIKIFQYKLLKIIIIYQHRPSNRGPLNILAFFLNHDAAAAAHYHMEATSLPK